MFQTKTRAKEVQKATSDGLQRIYLIIIGLAITHALRQTLTDKNGDFLSARLELQDNCIHVLLLITFLFTIIRFAHGSVIHLTALTSEVRWQWDMFSLLFQAILFFVVALSISKTSNFLVTFSLVLLINSLWLWFLKPIGHFKRLEKNWLISNGIILCIFIALYVCYTYSFLNTITIGVVAALCSMLSTIIDYYVNSSEYFPDAD